MLPVLQLSVSHFRFSAFLRPYLQAYRGSEACSRPEPCALNSLCLVPEAKLSHLPSCSGLSGLRHSAAHLGFRTEENAGAAKTVTQGNAECWRRWP